MSFGRLGSMGNGFGRLGCRGRSGSAPLNTIIAGAGAYLWSGDDMAPLVDHTIAAGGGTYTYTGQDASLLRSSVMAAGGGTYTYTGQDATLTKAAGASFSLSWTAHAEDTGGGTTVNYGTLAIGAADSNRIVVIAIGNRTLITDGTVATNGVSIGGVTATQVSGALADNGTLLMCTDIWQASVPTGTTANVTITYTNSSTRSGIDVYRVVTTTPTASAAVNAKAAASGANGSLTSPLITVPSGGGLIAIYGSRAPSTSNAVTWTNATADNVAIKIGTVTTVGSASSTTAGSTTITASISGDVASSSVSLSVAAWGP